MNLNTVSNGKDSTQTLYMIVKGELYNWMVPVTGDLSKIFKLDLFDQSGMGGDVIKFPVEVRHGIKPVLFIGPHKSDFKALLADTGMDLTDPSYAFEMSNSVAV